MALKVDILESDRFFTNADFAIRCAIKQSDEVTAQNITGWSLSWMMKRRETQADDDAAIVKATGDGIAITDGPNGVCVVSISDEDTLALKAGVYVHELKRTDAGSETPLVKGRAVLQASAHRS